MPTTRKDEARLRWEAERTKPARDVRERTRHLPADADDALVLEHNTWDDVEHDEEAAQKAEQVIRAQVVAPASLAASCVDRAAERWDAHYTTNIRNYRDRQYLQNEFPQLRPPISRSAVLLEVGCGVGNSLLPLLALHPDARVVGCDLSPTAVQLCNERIRREGLHRRGRA